MGTTAEARDAIIHEMDHLLKAQGFKRRRKSDYVWWKELSEEFSVSIHLNVGLFPHNQTLIVNPSLAVRYESFELELAEVLKLDSRYIRDRTSFMNMLSSLSGNLYLMRASEDAAKLAKEIYADVLQFGLPYLEKLSNLEQVIRLLSSNNPRDWCTYSLSDRCRLLPIALVIADRKKEAQQILPILEKEIEGEDQIIPPYAEFVASFSNRYFQNP